MAAGGFLMEPAPYTSGVYLEPHAKRYADKVNKNTSHFGNLCYTDTVRVISVKRLKDFWADPRYRDSQHPLRAWYAENLKANWRNSHQIKAKYGNASILGNDRIVFNISGNKYRLVVAVKYDFGIMYIRFIGTHKQYDKINAKEI